MSPLKSVGFTLATSNSGSHPAACLTSVVGDSWADAVEASMAKRTGSARCEVRTPRSLSILVSIAETIIGCEGGFLETCPRRTAPLARHAILSRCRRQANDIH